MIALLVLALVWTVPASILNVIIFRWGSTRLSRAFGNVPRPLDTMDWLMVALLSPVGPFGPVIGYFITDWWCSGFERKDGANDDRLSAKAARVPSSAPPIVISSQGWTGRPD